MSFQGTFITGVSLMSSEDKVVLYLNKWYEWILIFLPFLGFGDAIGGISTAFPTLFE